MGENEKEEKESQIRQEQNKCTLLEKDADNMKKQYISLFDNFSETEGKLGKYRDEMKEMEKILMEKDKVIDLMKLENNQKLRAKEEEMEKEIRKEKSSNGKVEEMESKSKGTYDKLVEAEEKLLDKDDDVQRLQMKLTAKEEECDQLSIELEKEKKGVDHRKLKVAKKMIKSEKEKQKVLVGEIDAKNAILSQMQR